MRFSILCPHAFTLNRLPMKHPNSSSARGRRCHIQMQSSAAYPCSSSALHPIAMKQLNSQNVQGKVPPIVKLIVLSMLLQFGISRYDFLGCAQFPGSYDFCADIVAPRLVRASGKVRRIRDPTRWTHFVLFVCRVSIQHTDGPS